MPVDAIILQGDRDTEVPISSTQKFLKYFPHVRMVKIRNGKHGFSGTQPEQAAKESIKFMNSHLKQEAASS